jgi:serine/threonine protein kinase
MLDGAAYVDRPLIIEAVGHAARKRRLLEADQASRLTDALHNRGIETLERLRSWLAGSHGMSVTLARELLKILARADQPPFGPYQPLAHLANGGMGSVWLAANKSRDGLVVVKAMRKDVAESPEFHKRFARETRIMMDLDSPGVVRCLDSGKAADDALYMVLEFVDGGDLKDLAEGRGVPEVMALQFASHVAGALVAANRQQLVHRDIKPANIFTYADGRAKLADFGIARSTSEKRTMLTMMGAMVGSPPNMSPEQVIGERDIDIRSDIYSVGTVLYYALTGQECYQGRLQEVLHAQRTAPVPDVRAVLPTVSKATADIITACMQKKREDRYQTPEQLAEALAGALRALGQTSSAVLAMPELPPRRPPAATPEREMTETMLSRLITTDGNAHGDSSVMLGQKTPTGFMAAGPVGQAADGSRKPGTTVVERQTPVPGENLVGDLATAFAGPWLTLVGAQPGRLVMLFAKPRLDMGKLREPPIDLCLRNYPLTDQRHRDASLRVSRHHLDLIHDPARSAVVLVDAGSGNGTVVDGAPLPPNQPLTLAPDREHTAVVAGAVTLRLRAVARQSGRLAQLGGGLASSGTAACGLDTEHLFDGVAITRPANQPELAYAMVLRRLSIGGPGADLALHGATAERPCEIALFDGRWIWRTATGAPWQPLAAGARLVCSGLPFTARAGSYEDF